MAQVEKLCAIDERGENYVVAANDIILYNM